MLKDCFFSLCGRDPRPHICSHNVNDCVARLTITVSTPGSSNPVVKISQLHKTIISPLLNAAIICFRIPGGVVPSICAAVIPAAMNASRVLVECSTLIQKQIAFVPGVCFKYFSTTPEYNFGLLNWSNICFASKSPRFTPKFETSIFAPKVMAGTK